ncbi:type II toxin-antitoxin system HicA family toxin [Mesorhizobium sp. M00.F.Ca.ET.170.01.1.1]|nr:type II toxin-antitoxin system HicA family toxin [Mesorhizobium sp. M00.F.Ca.ET.170.01.1.1]
MGGQLNKLCAAIRNNPKGVRFDDACKVARLLGYTSEKGAGSHRAFARPGDPVGLNFQETKNGQIPPYQAKQLIEALEKYEDEL